MGGVVEEFVDCWEGEAKSPVELQDRGSTAKVVRNAVSDVHSLHFTLILTFKENPSNSIRSASASI